MNHMHQNFTILINTNSALQARLHRFWDGTRLSSELSWVLVYIDVDVSERERATCAFTNMMNEFATALRPMPIYTRM